MRSAPVAALFTALVMMSGSVFAAGPTKGDPAKGKEIVDKVCAACHGADGNSVVAANPRLAGQHPEYIYKQLTEFKTQKRKNAVMFGMASTLSDDDMHNVAAYFSQQKPKEGGASDKTLIATGEKIYRGGIAAKNLPACMACHGPAGSGMPAQFPRVAGQHSAYVIAQLNTFRTGERNNNQVMVDVAGRMSDQDIKAVAEYIQSLH
ncbi:c-type cytochrome [Amantichitinum ursilacus]|uniref:Cytochrome c4 n=1 Tax=Amantichitinum ursilacus TaxID=857265 RepID=A0A0N0GL13_9NEIS|nr:c-type cytochrome [Amantichitinum ursilacus]KPC49355.1 Cytochrome c4 [Amantichitinum ursilacus]